MLGNQLFQVLPSGKLLLIALESGELQSTVNLGRPLARTPVHDESGQHLYVLGRQDCLLRPGARSAGVRLGRLSGPSRRLDPLCARTAGPVPGGSRERLTGRQPLHVLVLDEDGVKVRPVQEVEVSGWTWQTPASSGSIVWATGDKGGYEAFSVGDYASKTPFRSVARLTADASRRGRLSRWRGRTASCGWRRDIPAVSSSTPSTAAIEPGAPMLQPGPALAPIQTAGKFVVMTFQDQGNGGVALWGIDPETSAIVWKTVVGAPGRRRARVSRPRP